VIPCLRQAVFSRLQVAEGEIPMNTRALTNPTVKAAVEALQKGDREAWSALFDTSASRRLTGSTTTA
jgi:hypothetical protein